MGDASLSITSLQELRSHFEQLQQDGTLTEEAMRLAFKNAKRNDVNVTPDALKDIFDAFAPSVFGEIDDGSVRATRFFYAAWPVLSQPEEAGGVRLDRATLQIFAGADELLQHTEIDHATEILRDHFIRLGDAPDDGGARARQAILGELGARAGGVTLHSVEADQVVDLAKGYGDPLGIHTFNYHSYIADRAFIETRASVRQFASGLDPAEPRLVGAIQEAQSVDAIVRALEGAGMLTAAVEALAGQAKAPFKALFERLVGEPQGEQAAALRKLDDVEVVIVNADKDGGLSAGDLMAINLGSRVELRAVDQNLATELRVATAMQHAARDMTNSNGHSKFEFHGFPPKFNQEYFEGASGWGTTTAFRLKEGKGASAGIRDILANPDRYTFESATAIVLIWHVAQYNLYEEKYGDEADTRFDAKFAGMKIGAWRYGDQIRFDRTDIDPGSDVALAGEWRYFKAWDIDDAGKWRGWQGENVIYVGKADRDGVYPGIRKGQEMYFGHPFGITTKEHIISKLNEQRFNVDLSGWSGLEHHADALQAQIDATQAELDGLDDPGAAEQGQDVQARLEGLLNRKTSFDTSIQRLSDSATKRAEVRDYLSRNRSAIRDADNHTIDARIVFGDEERQALFAYEVSVQAYYRSGDGPDAVARLAVAESRLDQAALRLPKLKAYREAVDRYEELTTPLYEGEDAIDTMDAQTWAMARTHLEAVGQAIEDLKSDLTITSESPALQLLKSEYAALEALEPRAASRIDFGRVAAAD
ncbi:MAG: hypothetical protein V3T05_00045 [Myxococcota bacterium]